MKNKSSLVPYPLNGCECCAFYRIFDQYSVETKLLILTQENKKEKVNNFDWSWND